MRRKSWRWVDEEEQKAMRAARRGRAIQASSDYQAFVELEQGQQRLFDLEEGEAPSAGKEITAEGA